MPRRPRADSEEAACHGSLGDHLRSGQHRRGTAERSLGGVGAPVYQHRGATTGGTRAFERLLAVVFIHWPDTHGRSRRVDEPRSGVDLRQGLRGGGGGTGAARMGTDRPSVSVASSTPHRRTRHRGVCRPTGAAPCTAGAQIGSGCGRGRRARWEVEPAAPPGSAAQTTTTTPALPAPARLCRWWADSRWPASPFTPVVNPGLGHVALQAFFQRRGLDEIGRGETLGEGAVDTA
jgi:hypothetical protein